MIIHHAGKYIRSFKIRLSTNLWLHRLVLLISIIIATLMSSGTDEFFLETLQNFLCSCQKSLSSFLVGFFRDWRVPCGLPRAFTSPGVDTDVMWTLILSFIFNSCLYTIVPTILCRYFYPVLYSFIHFRLTIEISFLLVLHLRGEPGSVFSMTSLHIECCYNVHSNFLLFLQILSPASQVLHLFSRAFLVDLCWALCIIFNVLLGPKPLQCSRCGPAVVSFSQPTGWVLTNPVHFLLGFIAARVLCSSMFCLLSTSVQVQAVLPAVLQSVLVPGIFLTKVQVFALSWDSCQWFLLSL